MAEHTAFKIESNDLAISEIFKDFYAVPDFQREYVWEREHVEKLLEDVLDEFYDEDNRLIEGPEYFLGSIVACRDHEGHLSAHRWSIANDDDLPCAVCGS